MNNAVRPFACYTFFFLFLSLFLFLFILFYFIFLCFLLLAAATRQGRLIKPSNDTLALRARSKRQQ